MSVPVLRSPWSQSAADGSVHRPHPSQFDDVSCGVWWILNGHVGFVSQSAYFRLREVYRITHLAGMFFKVNTSYDDNLLATGGP
jgi:hypothetical protein